MEFVTPTVKLYPKPPLCVGSVELSGPSTGLSVDYYPDDTTAPVHTDRRPLHCRSPTTEPTPTGVRRHLFILVSTKNIRFRT